MNSNLDLFLEHMTLDDAEDQDDVPDEPIWAGHSPALG
jgi:hypothetical protein